MIEIGKGGRRPVKDYILTITLATSEALSALGDFADIKIIFNLNNHIAPHSHRHTQLITSNITKLASI